jgi:hypothetical protein
VPSRRRLHHEPVLSAGRFDLDDLAERLTGGAGSFESDQRRDVELTGCGRRERVSWDKQLGANKRLRDRSIRITLEGDEQELALLPCVPEGEGLSPAGVFGHHALDMQQHVGAGRGGLDDELSAQTVRADDAADGDLRVGHRDYTAEAALAFLMMEATVMDGWAPTLSQ